MLKKLFFCCAIFLTLALLCICSSALEVSAKHAVLIEAQSGDIIFSKNANLCAPMASTTKIMTAVVAIENSSLDEMVTITADSVGIEGSSIYLKEGERLSMKELLSALLLESANDAATAIAIHISGSVDEFATLMNAKAHELGLENTNFTNPHGLDNESHYTTAYELAKIAKYAMSIPVFKEIVSSKAEQISDIDGGKRLLVNHNKLLKRYDGACGIKTGFTKRCGRCLVSSAERDGVTLIAVTLNAPNDWNDHASMLDYGFSQYESVSLANVGDYTISLNCISGKKDEVLCTNFSSLKITLKKGEKDKIRAVLEAERFLFAPVEQGQRVGRIVYYLDNEEICSVPIYALEAIKPIKYKKSIFERIFS